ncbi:MAG: hypothetical protein CMJ78_25810 [Planctomycetaceae bacterium]|nr:hypothetical protein [Planctomycetaceae bacterium]
MNSAYRVISQDFARRAAPHFLVGVALFLGFPLMIYGFISLVSKAGAADIELETAPYTILYCEVVYLFCAAFVLHIQWGNHARSNTRLFTMPRSSSWIMAALFSHGILSVLAFNAVIVLVYRQVFGSQWPLWTSMCATVVGFSMLYALFMSAIDFRWWKLITIPLVFVGFCTALAQRFLPGGFESEPVVWSSVSAIEAVVMLGMIVVSYLFALRGFIRARQGELREWPNLTAMIQAAIQKIGDLTRTAGSGIVAKSGVETHFSLEFRSRGLVIAPAIGLTFGGLIFWLGYAMMGASPAPNALLAASFIITCSMSVFLGLAGVSCGNKQNMLGTFAATRPLSDRQFAFTIMRCLAYSTLISVTIVLLATGLVCLLRGVRFSPSPGLCWLFEIAMYYAAAWTISSFMSCMMLTGRGWLLSVMMSIFVCYLMFVIIYRTVFLTQENEAIFEAINQCIVGTLVLSWTVWAFRYAVSHKLIHGGDMLKALTIFVLVLIVETLMWKYGVSYNEKIGQATWPLFLMVVAISSLAVSWIAAAPVAVYFDRHR